MQLHDQLDPSQMPINDDNHSFIFNNSEALEYHGTLALFLRDIALVMKIWTLELSCYLYIMTVLS